MDRPPLPPFNAETAAQKARMAEYAWNSRDPAKVALAYTVDSRWRNRAEMFKGREAIEAILTRKWGKELDYRLIKEVWAFHDNRIAVRFAYEWHDDSGNWFRSYGNENWEFDAHGLMRLRIASINDLPTPSRPGEFHPEPLTEPDLTLSRHPARATARRLPPSIEHRTPPVAGWPEPMAIARSLRSTSITLASLLSGRRRRPLKGSPPSATQTE